MLDPLLIVLSFLVAVLVGSTGIGGLLLAPTISLYSGVPIQVALPASMVALLLSGVVGTLIFGGKGSIVWPHALPLAIGAAPGAFLGSFALSRMPSNAAQLVIAILAVLSGIHSMRNLRRPATDSRFLGVKVLVGTGLVTGFLSALTGSSGPLVLLPILLFMNANMIEALGLAQMIQIPIGLFATVGYLAFGRIDLTLAASTSIAVVAGATVGALGVHSFPIGLLRVIGALTLISAGVYYIVMIRVS
ncbi:MAG: sulfite exporter TauE/SafE family protein [Proteobacteria bacterium]|nr:sulfite exporter TauE/SafE family protein [Pseudomonadota bacterium]